MGYDKKKIHSQALNLVKDKNLFFIEHLINYLPVSKNWFYDNFSVGSNEYDTIKDLLDKNRTSSCNDQLNDWLKSENATLKIAAYKQICNDEQRKYLSTNWNQNEHSGDLQVNTKFIIEYIDGTVRDE